MQDGSKIYHMSNVTGKEKLITSGRINELTHALLTHSVVKAFMAYRTGLDGTMQHYLAVRQAKVTVCSKIRLRFSLTWQTDHCTPWRMAFKVVLNTKAALS